MQEGHHIQGYNTFMQCFTQEKTGEAETEDKEGERNN